MDQSELRLFVALPIPGEMRSKIAFRIGQMKKTASFRKWVHPEDLHITLYFLGECSQRTGECVKERLEELAPTVHPFRLKLGALGFFGAPQCPRILWSGVGGELDALQKLQREVVSRLSPLGFPVENRPFRPHLTLARNCRQRDFSLDGMEALWLEDVERPEWEVRRIVLYRSHLGRTPMYEPVESFELRG